MASTPRGQQGGAKPSDVYLERKPTFSINILKGKAHEFRKVAREKGVATLPSTLRRDCRRSVFRARAGGPIVISSIGITIRRFSRCSVQLEAVRAAAPRPRAGRARPAASSSDSKQRPPSPAEYGSDVREIMKEFDEDESGSLDAAEVRLLAQRLLTVRMQNAWFRSVRPRKRHRSAACTLY